MAGYSVWPAVVDALLAKAPARVGDDVMVIDGAGVEGDDVASFLFIGLGDPRRDDSDAGSFDQEWNMSTTAGRRETGSVFCIALSYEGSTEGGQKVARDRCFAIVAAVQRMLKEDTRLGGVDGLLSTSFTGGQPDQVLSDRGAACAVRFSVDFTAQIKE